MTWLLVSTRPSEFSTIPVPSAVSLEYCRVEVMSTTPGSTLFATDWTFSPELVLPPELLPGIGMSCEDTPVELPVPLLLSATAAPAPAPAASTATATRARKRPRPRWRGGSPYSPAGPPQGP